MILDTFYLLFKSNAGDTKKDISALDKQIGDLAQKGKARSEQETKQLKDLRKLRSEQTADLKDQQKTLDSTGESFVKLAEAATQAATAFFAFGAIKAGIANAAAFNTTLERTHQATGQSVEDLAVFGNAIEQFGGNAADMQNIVRNWTQQAAQAGRQLPPIAGFLKDINQEMQGLSLNEQNRRLGMLQIDPGSALAQLLRETPQQYEASIEKSKEFNAANAENTEKSLKFSQALTDVHQAFEGVYTTVGNDLLPALTSLLELLADFGKFLKGHNILAEEFLSVAGIGITLLAGSIVGKLIPALVGLQAASAAALIPFAQIAAIAGVGVAATFGAGALGQSIGQAANRVLGRGDKDGYFPVKTSADIAGSQAFWKSQGYSDAATAGLIANELRESSGNAGKRGDGGSAVGLFQWHPRRVKAILNATGIDVRTAGRADQLKAAAWELQNMGIAEQLQNATSPSAAASLISRKYEIPANADKEAAIRSIMAGQIAINSASSNPLSSTSSNISNVGGDRSVVVSGPITIHTQASNGNEVATAFRQSLADQIRTTQLNYDDGVKM